MGISYCNDMGLEVDKKKAKHYYELTAMNGHLDARHILGRYERIVGNLIEYTNTLCLC